MRNKVYYEWDIEIWEEDGEDIIDHQHDEKCPTRPLLANERLVLVRDVGNDIEGLVDRSWAYVREDGTLPERFDYGLPEELGVQVPKRFHEELKRARG